ncbi:TWiK family of potassium channels protein 18 [Trichostrongylus colubriformis]|uniref:TWiK family of potassium channels protein 18 n=1 Tax=Trichostrongylus colubriformis TaxID=6319 RepID=A0AAN8FPR9_TRICO
MSAPIARKFAGLISALRNRAKALLPLLGLIIYTLLGAILFSELEGPNEQYELEQLRKERQELFESTVYRLNNVRGMQPMAALNHTRKSLLKFQEKLGIEPVNLEETRWNFWGAVFYCMTVYTTIGYGNIVPVTTPGRVLTILYAFIGIPFAVLTLFALGMIFARICKMLWKLVLKSTSVVHKDLGRKVNAAVGFDENGQMSRSSSSLDDEDLLSFPISFLIFLTVLWVLLCAWIFTLLEDWSYGTSLYFTLISFTTIGFGDVLPSEYDYIIIVGFLLLIGLSLVSTVLTLIQQQIEALASGMQANIDREYMNALAEAADEGAISDADFKRMHSGNNTAEAIDISEPKEVDPRSMDAVISRMPFKERILYRVMPASAKKRLNEASEQKLRRKNKASQTDMFLLEALLHEEILKMELNNELPTRQVSSSPSRVVGTSRFEMTRFERVHANTTPLSIEVVQPRRAIMTCDFNTKMKFSMLCTFVSSMLFEMLSITNGLLFPFLVNWHNGVIYIYSLSHSNHFLLPMLRLLYKLTL